LRRLVIFASLLLAQIAVAQSTDRRVSVAVAGLFHSSQFVVEASPAHPLVVHVPDREFVIGDPAHARAVFTRAGKLVSVRAAGVSMTVPSATVTGRSSDSDFTLSIPSRFRRQYHGTLNISAAKGELVPVVTMDMETAVASVVAAETPPGAPLEFLKALAIAARSYLVAAGPRHPQADFCDTTHCQYLREPPVPGSPAARAAADTRGLVLTFEGKPFAAMYSASCGGRTHSLVELGLRQRDYPYYPVECAYCRRNPDRWSARIAEAEAQLAAKGERERIQLARRLGWNVVPSNNFQSRETPAGAELSGVGHGHGLGLCQRGAAAMAREGSSFRVILAHYYPNSLIDSLHE